MDNVTFNEANHSYTNDSNKKRYTSATTIISKFKQPFDKVAVSKAYAKKNGGTAEEWQAKWSEISKIACEKGTNFHAKKENEILESIGQRPLTPSEAFILPTTKRVTNLDFKSIPDGIQTEVVVYNHYFEIAGQLDFMNVEGSYFDIDDHKTNKKIDMWSFRHPKTGYKMMQFPLQHLMDTNYNHYNLQLSLYAFMIEQLTGKKVRSLSFTHYPPDILEDDGISKEGVKYNLPYLKKEVLDMLAVMTGKDISQFK